MRSKRLCIVTMIGPVELIGYLVRTDEFPQFAMLEHPCVLQPKGVRNFALLDMTRGSPVIQGDAIAINMRSVLWISEPSNALRSTYLANCADPVPGSANNNVHIDHPIQ